MIRTGRDKLLYAVILAGGLVAPFALPDYNTQLSFLWIMIVFALTWDIMGGQMGYNSFGNIVFFGIGMYVSAMTQVGLYYDLGEYTASYGAIKVELDAQQYFVGLAAGTVLAAIVPVLFAAVLGSGILTLRGHYFAICTLGLGIAAGEFANGWDFVGAGAGFVTPLYPGEITDRQTFFYFLCFAVAIATFLFLRWLYSTRFGHAINAIRDDEDKAEALGIHTTRYKTLAWCVSAFFLGMTGAFVGNIVGFIDPTDVAFAGPTFGVWMVLMAILGGKGTLWGPVIGATVFHVTQELFWTYLLGWQRVALGLLIVVIVVFFPTGIVGWVRERWPERFGHKVQPATEAEENAP